MRRIRRIVAVMLAATVCNGVVACGASPRSASSPVTSSTAIRVASFDFPESRLLAELYASALERHGYPVRRVFALGSREVVEPALQQRLVDMVPEYLGTALNFLNGGHRQATADPAANHAQLKARFSALGVTVLRPAAARDSNGFAVRRSMARDHDLRRISDLQRLAPSLVLGGPAECAERALCMLGLRDVYGLHFREFRPLPTGAVIADALRTGEVDVGMLDTTSGQLADQALQLLADDRELQPAENVVPVVNRDVVTRLGKRFVRVVDAVSARLDTASLVDMNRAVETAGRPAHAVVEDWLRSKGLW